jgi:branched-chain amino acid transport system substrate-binding protein
VSVTGCGGHSRPKRTGGVELSIYTSLPFAGPYAADAQAVFDGEQLALAQAGSKVNGSKIVLRALNDANSTTGSIPGFVDEDAHIAAADPSTIAYIGELTPGSSTGSIRILSPLGILQVSPGDSATGLAAKTFARVVPPASDEAAADLSALGTLGVKTVYLIRDRTTYGRDIAAAVRADAPASGILVADSSEKYLPANPRALVRAIKKAKAGALVYAGLPGPSVAGFWNALTAADPVIKKFASAAIAYSPNWDQTTAAARYDTYLSAPGLSTRTLPRAGSEFETDFLNDYGSHAPWESGIFGYVAMSGILEALHSMGVRPRDPRRKIVSAFLGIKNLPSALGTYSIADGQTSFQAYHFTSYSRSGVRTAFVRGLP